MQNEMEEEEALPGTIEELQAWAATASPGARDAQASTWLRLLGYATADVARLDVREQAELETVAQHYARARAPLAQTVAELTRCLEALAPLMTYPRGRKSIDYAFGTLGTRTTPSRVAVVDADAALTWARTALPSAIRTKESVDVRAITPAVMAAGAADGFEIVPATETPVVKPNSAALAGVVS